MCFLVVFLILVYGPYIFMLVRATQALQATRPRNRSISPGLVWIGLIPCVNVIFNFLIVLKTSEALKNEFEYRRLRNTGDHGKQLGLTYAVLVVVNIAISGVNRGLSGGVAGNNGPVAVAIIGLGCVSLILLVGQIVLSLVYALKIHQSTLLLRRDDRYDDDDDDDDEADDEPKRRPKPKKLADDDFEEFDEPGDNPPKGGR